MLMYSTVLDIDESLTRDDFIRLVIEWNQSSPHQDCVIPDLKWSGQGNIRYGDGSLWLGIEEYRNQNTVAIRYEMTNAEGVVWDTDFIMNFDEMRMAIQLDRSLTEGAQVEDYRFSVPYFVTLLIEKGYLKDDNGLPVLRDSIDITSDNVGLIASIVNHERQFNLPVIYISKTSTNHALVNVDKLCSSLKGVAHVLLEQSCQLDSAIRNACGDQNEYLGAVGVYFPNGDHKRLLPKKYCNDSGLFAKRIIRIVLQYANAQKTDLSYTWAGVTYSLLSDRKSAADYARQVAENQREEYVDAFDQENKELHQKVDELTAKNASLEAEVRGLRRKLNNAEGTPLLVYGEEEEFFPDEIKEMILEELEKRANNLSSGTRRSDVLNDVLEANPVQGKSDQRRSNLRNALTDYSKMMPSKKRQLQDLGFEIDEDGKHYSLSYYGDSRYFTTLPKSGSDWRGGRNSVSEIIQKLM